MSYEYDQYLIEHRSNVYKAFKWLTENLLFIFESPEQAAIVEDFILRHDESKNELDEYEAYDKYFYGGNRSYAVVEDFQHAFLMHLHRNPHHWQYWILTPDSSGEPEKIIEMPPGYAIEMICDWWSFSWRQNNLEEIFSWYEERKDYIKLHPATRIFVENTLEQMKEKLGEPELMHYGVKGMKWGVRRTEEELGHLKGLTIDKLGEKYTIKKIISGHSSAPKQNDPYSVIDHVGDDGKVDKRSYYGKTGMKELDIHASDHGNAKEHKYGAYGEHTHEFAWYDNGSIKQRTTREILSRERKENKDIL